MLELALLDYKMLRWPPSLTASAAIYLARKIANHDFDWKNLMGKTTQYEEKEVRPVAKDLLKLIKNARK